MKKADDASPRRRGRPLGFDRERALDTALRLFWERGYEGTSVADLVAAMGITPPSLYTAFGSKEQLYREALEHYARGPGHGPVVAMAEEPTAYRAIARILRENAVEFPTGRDPGGCMISIGALSYAPENQGVAAAMLAMRNGAIDGLRHRLGQALAAGELPEGTDIEGLARFYGAIIQGMSVQARDGADRAALDRIVDVALAAWPGSRD